MAVLSFKVQADYEKVVKLREEIAKLETQLRGVGKNTPSAEIKELERKLSEAKGEFTSLATEAAKAGSAMDKNFKADIRSASKEVDAFTAKIIEQKAIIKDTESDIRKFGKEYQKAFASGKTNEANEWKQELDAARSVLDERKQGLFDLTQEQAKARLKVKDLKNAYAEFKDEAGETTKANEGFQLSLGKVAGIIGGVAALKQLASQVVAVRAQFQDMETQIETLVGKDTTAKIMPQIKEMAKISPLTMTDIVGAEKMMLSFNIEAEKSIDYLKALSDVSMGNSQKFNSLTLAFSQMSSAGRLMGQDLLQMINAGFNPLQIISEKTGKSIAQLKEEMSKGAISAEMVQQAFLDATAAGGKFYNMSENASKTINGQISMMQDAMDAVFNEIGTKTEGIIIKSIQTVTKLIQNYEKIGKVLVGLIATYGAYRTAVVLVTAAKGQETLAEIALTKAKLAAKAAQDALNKSMLTNPYVALAVVVAGLVAAMWALSDSTTSAERAQEKYARDKEEAANKEKEHADAIQGLIDKVRDETQAESERILALEALKNEYPNIFAQYDIEKLKLEDILKIKKQINEEDAARKSQGLQDSLADIDAQIAKAEAALQDAMSMGSVRYIKNSQAQVDTLKAYREQLVQEILNSSIANFNASLTDASLDELQAYQKQLDSGTFELEGKHVDDKTKETLKKSVEAAINKLSTATTYSQDYKAAQKEWETVKKELDKIEKDKDAYTTKQYEEAKARKETAEKNFKKLGGDTTGKGAKTEADAVKTYNEQLAQQEKVEAAQKRSDKERARTAKDMEFMVEQARISAMKEGAEKKRAQRELDDKKELESLERQKQDYIEKVVEAERAVFDAQEEQRAKNDKNYKKQTFDSEAAAKKVDTKAYDDAIIYTTNRQKSQQDEVLKELLDKYKSYEDKKQEIVIAYLNESDELQAMYEQTGDERYKRSLDERHKAYLQAMYALEQEADSAYKQIFRDPSKMTEDGLNKALDLAEEKLQKLIDSGAEADSLEPLYNQIKAIREELDNYNISGIVSDLMSLVKQAENLREARVRLETLDVNSELYRKEKEAVDRASDNLKKSLVATGVSEFNSLLEKSADAMHQIAQESGDIKLDELANAFDTASGIINSSVQGMLQAGPWGLLVGLVTSTIGAIANLAIEAKIADAKISSSMANFRREIQLTQLVVDEADFSGLFGSLQFDVVQDSLIKAKNAIGAFIEESEKLKSLSWKYGTGISWFPEEGVLFETYDKIESLKNADVWDESGLLDVEKAEAFLATSETITDEARKQVQHAIELQKAYDEAQRVIDDFLSSFIGSTASDITDAIFEGIDNGSDAWDIFEEKGAEAIRALGKQMLQETIMKNLSDVWTDKLREAAGDPNALADTYAQMMEWLKSQMGAYQEAAQAWEGEYGHLYQQKEGTEQQEATSKGYQSLSEDTGNELVGRALAQYESNLRMEEAMRLTKESVDIMAANQVYIRDIAAESRALIADSYLELQQIRENTGAVIKPIKDMSAKMADWDTYIKRL